MTNDDEASCPFDEISLIRRVVGDSLRPMRLLYIALGILLAGCIDSARKSTSDSDVSAVDTVTETSAPPSDGSVEPADVGNDGSQTIAPETDVRGDVLEDPIAPTDIDTVEPSETDETNDDVPVEVVSVLACLPAGCVAPGVGCALEPDFCFIAGDCVFAGIESDDSPCLVCDVDVDPLGWSAAGDGKVCDDGLACTNGDVCLAGVCQGEVDCPGGQSCLTPRCDAETNSCRNDVDDGRCHIDETCYSTGELARDRCGSCQPDKSRTTWTPGDSNEPDGDLDFANGLGFNGLTLTSGTTQDPAWNGPWTDSTLSPASDLDAFGFVYPTSGGFLRPVARFDTQDVIATEACIYLRCLPNDEATTRPTPIVVCSGSDTKKTNGDWVGCCRDRESSGYEFTLPQAWCEVAGNAVVTDGEAGITLRRRLPPAEPICLPYTLRWAMR